MLSDKLYTYLAGFLFVHFFFIISKFVSISFTGDPFWIICAFLGFYDYVTVHVYMPEDHGAFLALKDWTDLCIYEILTSLYFIGYFSNLLPDGNQK